MAQTARKAFVTTLVAVGVIVLALALWKLRLVVALLFAGFIIAAAMRPGIEALYRRGVPRAAGLGLHYAVIAGVLALGLWFAVPRATEPGHRRGREPPRDPPGDRRRGEAIVGHQAGDPAQPAAPPEGGAERRHALHDGEGGRRHRLRDRHRDLLRVRRRRLLDLRAGEGDEDRRRAVTKTEAKGRARHVAADRSQARRLRPRHRADRGHRCDGALAALLGDRVAVLAARRLLRGIRRDRAGDRAAGRCSARGRASD